MSDITDEIVLSKITNKYMERHYNENPIPLNYIDGGSKLNPLCFRDIVVWYEPYI
jgi:hypothetical protein